MSLENTYLKFLTAQSDLNKVLAYQIDNLEKWINLQDRQTGYQIDELNRRIKQLEKTVSVLKAISGGKESQSW